MAKDDRAIHHGISFVIPHEGKKTPQLRVFASGMEDELAAVMTQKQLDDAIKRGDISGKWKSTKK
jgi:hypothetical protein